MADPADEHEVAPDLRHWLLVIAVNLLMLLELFVAMYFASAVPDAFSATFMKVFFGLLLPTLIAFVLLKRRLRC